MSFFNKMAQGLKKTKDSVMNQINATIFSFSNVSEELFEELEEILIMSDIGAATAAAIVEKLRVQAKLEKVASSEALQQELKKIVTQMLEGDSKLHLEAKPSVILVVGVNGVGKTTSIAKIANQLKQEGKKVMLGAADTFRAAAIDQLSVWSQRVGVEIIAHAQGADPGAVVFDTIAAAKARGSDVVICDTAGRLHNKKNLMDELNKIFRIIRRELPEVEPEVLLVLDATTGQNALSQVRQFKEAAPITGIVLTKLDGTAKGGIVIAIKNELNVPVKYIGVGEKIDDLLPFEPKEFAEALFD
jgi:fused signal recognition particle receptor